MNWPASLLVSFLNGILGVFLGGLIGIACVKWFRISSFEGASGYAVDFIPEVRAILAQAKIPTESVVLRDDVCRIASHYLSEWTTLPKP